jgi:SAM-dependent methyltransferase
LTAFDFSKKDFDFAIIAGYGDLHLLPTLELVEKAFTALYRHIRPGGCLALELTLPAKESYRSPRKRFDPRVPRYTDKKIWKENENRYDAVEKRHYIDQTVYIEDANGVESFTQSVCLQFYEREDILSLLRASGFTVQGEFCDRNRTPWEPGCKSWLVEAVK